MTDKPEEKKELSEQIADGIEEGVGRILKDFAIAGVIVLIVVILLVIIINIIPQKPTTESASGYIDTCGDKQRVTCTYDYNISDINYSESGRFNVCGYEEALAKEKLIEQSLNTYNYSVFDFDCN